MDSIDLSRAVQAPFKDPQWVSKTALGFLWLLIGVTAPAVYGAQVEYIRSVRSGNDQLPEWSDFGRKWVDGLLIAIAAMLYSLPVIILGAIFVVPAVIALIASGDSGDPSAALAVFFGGQCVFWIIAMVYVIAMSILFNAAIVHYAERGSFGAFFEFGTIMSKVRGGTGYFMAWLYAFAISAVASTVASAVISLTGGLLGILYPAVGYLVTMMTAHVLGQWAARAYGSPAPAAYAPTTPPVA